MIDNVSITVGISDNNIPENIKMLIDDLICELNPSTEEIITLLEEHNITYNINVVINTNDSIVIRKYTLENTDTDPV